MTAGPAPPSPRASEAVPKTQRASDRAGTLEGPAGGESQEEGRRRLPVRWLVLASLVLAAMTLLLPSTPTYDPWAWLTWGREVAALDLDTREGPSWKPLPVLFTTVFSLAGDAAPALWLVVARAGGVLATILAYRLGRRLAGGPLGVVAGLTAAGALVLTPGWVLFSGLGDSEGLLLASVLWAVERHLDGHRGHAFVLGFAAALLRPEVWPFLGLYGLYLWRAEPRQRPLVGALGALVPALWFLPELWGSGEALRASSRAQAGNPGNPAFAEQPALELLRRARTLLIAPVKAGAAIGLVAAAYLWLARRRDGATLFVALGGAAWLGLVAVMAELGYPGTMRYLLPPAALGCVVAGVGLVRVAEAAGWAARRLAGGARRLAPAVSMATLGVLVAASIPFALARGPYLADVAGIFRLVDDLDADLATAVERAGGRDRVRACGRPWIAGPSHQPLDFDVTALAWELRVHIAQVAPVWRSEGNAWRHTKPHPPATVFRAHPPSFALAEPRFRSVARAGDWEVLAACADGAGARAARAAAVP